MRLYYVVARDIDGCDVAIDQQLTRKEAGETFMAFMIDKELHEAGAVRVQMCEEDSDECTRDERVAEAA